MKKIFHFLISKMFWKNVLFAVIAICLLALAVHLWMKSYTRHGQKITLPDFVELLAEVKHAPLPGSDESILHRWDRF